MQIKSKTKRRYKDSPRLNMIELFQLSATPV
jgi:hypothetical protein